MGEFKYIISLTINYLIFFNKNSELNEICNFDNM